VAASGAVDLLQILNRKMEFKINITMKRIVLLLGILVCLTAAHVVLAQVTEGVITYEVKVNMHRNLPADRQEMKNIVPEHRLHQEQLLFNASESLYKPLEQEDEEEGFGDPHGGIRMQIRRPQNEFYVRSGSELRIALQEFMGKKYLIEDTIKIAPWKFGTETKTILGYECRQAVWNNTERKQMVTAWYTPQLRASLGPETIHTLPGAVLEININDGERIVTAKKIEPMALKKNVLKAPANGTKITREEFQKMVNEQIERMRSGGGNVIIRN
jgi:GLPGLI family protein